MKYVSTSISTLLICLALPSCSAQGSPPQSEVTTPTTASKASSTSSPATPQSGKTEVDDLKAFATNGEKIIDSKTGDLTGNGAKDEVLVLGPPVSGEEKLGEGPARVVLLLIRNASGELQKAAQNNTIVPCAQCGGIAGDPYSYTRIAKAQFTIVTEGGSRQHWSNEYTFSYEPTQKDWLLHEVKREVSDQETGKQKTLDLLPKDFGTVTFNNFDPSKLPKLEMQ